MKMKKLAALLLAALMLMSMLAGCGDDPTDIGGNVNPLESTNGTENNGSNVTPPEDPTNNTTTPDESTAPQDPTDDNPLSIGRMEGGTYTNQYIGITCTLDKTWTFYSAEELQELPGQVEDLFDGSQLGDMMKDMEKIIDMQAECVADLTTMNIVYQKLSMKDRLTYATMTEGQIIDTILSQQDLLEEAFSQAGITVKSMSKKTVTFADKERTAVYIVAEIQGIAYYILQLHNYQLGEYSATITLGSYVDDKTADLLPLFSAIE